jgi:hypothetical protein
MKKTLAEHKTMEGNRMKMREAMEAIRKEVYHYAIEEDKQDFAHLQEVMLEDPPEYKDLRNSFLAIAHLVDAALSSPARQCDVGTADEQKFRHSEYCKSMGICCSRCPLEDTLDCRFAWMQTPYEAKEGGAK